MASIINKKGFVYLLSSNVQQYQGFYKNTDQRIHNFRILFFLFIYEE